jgi:formylglycine-generating enzyme required for sulfatase activity
VLRALPAGAAASHGAGKPAKLQHDAVAAITPVSVTGGPIRADRDRTESVFRDCLQCPEMVRLPGGTFSMGSKQDSSEGPVHQVALRRFALGRFAVTVGEWRQCVAAKACAYEPSGDDRSAVRNVSWADAQEYVSWLSRTTQNEYRLPTEAEWEYAARAGTTTRFYWGNQLVLGAANCKGCGGFYENEQPLTVGSFVANPFGLHDMAGGVGQWVADCWHKNYAGAPRDGSSWDLKNCRERVLRGGSWKSDPGALRSAARAFYDPNVRYPTHGFRVARSD